MAYLRSSLYLVFSLYLSFVAYLRVAEEISKMSDLEDKGIYKTIISAILHIFKFTGIFVSFIYSLFFHLFSKLFDFIETKIKLEYERYNLLECFLAFTTTSIVLISAYLFISGVLIWGSTDLSIVESITTNLAYAELSLNFIIAYIVDNIVIVFTMLFTPKFYLLLLIQILFGLIFLASYYYGMIAVDEFVTTTGRAESGGKPFFVLNKVRSLKLPLLLLAVAFCTLILFILSATTDVSNIEIICLVLSLMNVEVTAGTVTAIAAPEIATVVVKKVMNRNKTPNTYERTELRRMELYDHNNKKYH